MSKIKIVPFDSVDGFTFKLIRIQLIKHELSAPMQLLISLFNVIFALASIGFEVGFQFTKSKKNH